MEWIILSLFYTDKSSNLLGQGRRKKIPSHKITEQTDGIEESLSDNAFCDKQVYKVNQEGRYICHLCEKTFKTVSHHFICVIISV